MSREIRSQVNVEFQKWILDNISARKSFALETTESDVAEFASGEFAIYPCLGLGSSGVINLPRTLQRLPFRHGGSSPHAYIVPGVRVPAKVLNQQHEGLDLPSTPHL
jgi:hypothetical protein